MTTVENGKVVPQKSKNRVTMWSSDSTSGYMPREERNWKQGLEETSVYPFL